MPRHTLKLLVLLAIFSVAPATARHATAAAGHRSSDCPYARARAEAAARAAASKGATTITLTDRAPASGSLLGRSAVLSP
jgi:uncharacterized membrane-anchored protein